MTETTDRVLPLLSFGGLDMAGSETPDDLKPLVTQALGKPVRRIGRFIQLALIGAARCINDTPLSPETPMWLASGAGDMNVTVDVLERICRDKQSPKPLAFINTVSNAACFYVANRFGLTGLTTFVSRRGVPLQLALQAAMTEALLHDGPGALVGGVDEASLPLDLHRRRLGLAKDTPAGEGSWWFRFGPPVNADALPDTAMGALVDVRMFATQDDVTDWIVASIDTHDDGQLVVNHVPNSADDPGPNAPTAAGRYDVMAGAAIAAALEDPDLQGKTYLHVDRDPGGAWCVMEWQMNNRT